MKNIKRFSALVGAVSLFAVAITGCSNFAGTEFNYSEKETQKLGSTGIGVTSLTGATVDCTNTISVASERSTIEVTITNGATETKIDIDSAKAAMQFYTLKENNPTSAYLMKDADLPKPTVWRVTEDPASHTTTFELELNTSTVTKNTIALFVDATKLKDKQGNLILNGDGNYKRGESTDSVVKHIAVTTKADKTTATDSISGAVQDFSPDFTFNTIAYAPTLTYLTGTDGYATGEYEVRVTPKTYNQTAYNDTAAINKNLSAKLNAAYKLCISKPGATATEKKDLSFSWDETKGYYKASAGNLEVGTKGEIETTFIDLSDIAPTWYEAYYGAKAFTKQSQIGYKSLGATATATVVVAEPDFIVDSYTAADYTAPITAATWHAKTAIDPATAQQSFLSVGGSAATKFTVRLPAAGDLEFASENNDFMVIGTIDSVEVKLPIKVTYKKNDANVDNKLKQVEIEITNKNLSYGTSAGQYNNVKVYVGNGTALKANPKYPKQVKFGTYKNVADGIHSGFVALN